MEKQFRVSIMNFQGEVMIFDTHEYITARDIYTSFICLAKWGELCRIERAVPVKYYAEFNNKEYLIGAV